jgi:hypothetical protein
MDSNQLSFLSNIFFELSNNLPNQLFKNHERLNFYCYQNELFSQHKSLVLLFKKLRTLQSTLDSEEIYYYVEPYLNQTCYEKVFKVADFRHEPEFIFDALTIEDYDNMHIWRRNVYLSDETKKWGCLLAIGLEWVIFGVDKSINDIFKNIFLDCKELDVLRYKDTNSAINYNYPTGTASKEFRSQLLLNYNFL